MAPRNGGVMPCINEDCRYPTRTARSTLTDYPNTRSRRGGGLCHVCHYKTLPKPVDGGPKRGPNPDDPPNPATIAAHDTFLAARRAREARAARRMYPGTANPRSTR